MTHQPQTLEPGAFNIRDERRNWIADQLIKRGARIGALIGIITNAAILHYPGLVIEQAAVLRTETTDFLAYCRKFDEACPEIMGGEHDEN